MNPPHSETLPRDVARLREQHGLRRLPLFVVSPALIDRQNQSIVQAATALFQRTEALRSAADAEQLLADVAAYRQIYADAPVVQNLYGVNFTGGLWLFLIARRLSPRIIVESGVYKGLTTYLLSVQAPKSMPSIRCCAS
jgi:hypothetical protein